MLMAFKSALDGPVMPIQDRAVTCGGIIVGSMNKKPKAVLPRTSNSVSSSANPPPRMTAAIMPRIEVVSVS
ncbi:hypothetical protein D3C87_1465580 [compost metagenome]